MSHFIARELRDGSGNGTGLWHYVCTTAVGEVPVGYCSPWEQCHVCRWRLPLVLGGPPCDRCGGTRLVRKPIPCPGHETPEGAEDHFREWLIDHATYVFPSAVLPTARMDRCAICGLETQAHAMYGIDDAKTVVPLCVEHCDRAGLEPFVLVGPKEPVGA